MRAENFTYRRDCIVGKAVMREKRSERDGNVLHRIQSSGM